MLLRICIVVSVAMMVLATEARAQDPLNSTRFQLPSAGPSGNVGQTGGRNTRGVDIGSTGRRRGGNPIRLPNEAELGRGSPLPRVALPPAFQMGRVGFAPSFGGSNRLYRYQTPVDTTRLQSISGLSRSMRRGRPLLDPPRVYPRDERLPYFAPRRPKSAFHDFFDLTPEDKPEVKEVLDEAPPLNYADLLERENDLFSKQKRERALLAFKKGTTRSLEGRYQHLTTALDLFAGLRRVSNARKSGEEFDEEIAVLSMHGYLEKGQLAAAGRALIEVVRERPDFFSEKPDVSEFFGDEDVLQALLRDNRRVGELNPVEPIAWGLQAYCHWMLGDAQRARESVEKMREFNQTFSNDPRIEVVAVALEVALD